MVEQILEESHADPARRPQRTEPWSVDQGNSSILRNRFGRVAASVASEREARRLVAAVKDGGKDSSQKHRSRAGTSGFPSPAASTLEF
jgi:hypothetical protein